MNHYHFLVMTEKLLSLYDNDKIMSTGTTYTQEFIALIGEMKDAISTVE